MIAELIFSGLPFVMFLLALGGLAYLAARAAARDRQRQ